jgi:hypothetical protein
VIGVPGRVFWGLFRAARTAATRLLRAITFVIPVTA